MQRLNSVFQSIPIMSAALSDVLFNWASFIIE